MLNPKFSRAFVQKTHLGNSRKPKREEKCSKEISDEKGANLPSTIEGENVDGARGPRGWENLLGARTQGLSRTKSSKEEFPNVPVNPEKTKK